MATLVTTNVIGAILLPDGAIPQESYVTFQLDGHDTDAITDVTIPPDPRTFFLDAAGDLDADLWPNDRGIRVTLYSVLIGVSDGRAVTEYAVGKIEVPSSGPVNLNDLLPLEPPSGISLDQYLAELASSVASAAASAAAAAASEANINELYPTVPAFLASTEASRGVGEVWHGGGFRYVEVSGTGHVTNSAGSPVQFDVLRGDFGYNLTAFGWLDDYSIASAAIVVAALDAVDELVFPAGTYRDLDITQSNKTIRFEAGVAFKLPDGTSSASDTVAFSAFEVTGASNRFFGDIDIDGNPANNSSAATIDRKGAWAMQGDNNNWIGDVNVLAAYWVGYSIGADDTSATNDFYHTGTARCKEADSYAFVMWSCDNWSISRVVSEDTVQDLDHRIRTGTQTLSTKSCKNGYIGEIKGEHMLGVFEVNTNNLIIDSILLAGYKLEEVNSVIIGNSISVGCTIEAFGFGVIDSTNCSIGQIIVKEYTGAASTTKPVSLDGALQMRIGSILIEGSNTSSPDFNMRSAQDLHIGALIAVNPLGTGIGVQFDYDVAYAPQERIIIDSIISTGHTGLDIEIQNYGVSDIQIGLTNPDATSNVAELSTKDKYVVGEYNTTLTTTSGSITLDQNDLAFTQAGRVVRIQGRIRAGSVSSPSGSVDLLLPRPVASVGGEADRSATGFFGQGLSGLPAGAYTGTTNPGTSTATLHFLSASAIQANTILIFDFTYITDA